MPKQISIGDKAPDFDIECITNPTDPSCRATLQKYSGKWLLLVFYARDFSLVCPSELSSMNERIDEFKNLGCELLAISIDTIAIHREWLTGFLKEKNAPHISFPLCSDHDGKMAKSFGVFDESKPACHRALFMINPKGIIQYMMVQTRDIGRGTGEILRTLAALTTEGFCSANWKTGDALQDASSAMKPGTNVASYRLAEILGDGSFGIVFKAQDLTLKRTVALKILKPGTVQNPQSILQEARSAARLNHPNICTIYAVDDSCGLPLIAMEFLSGKTLAQRMADAPLKLEQISDWGRQIAAGLAAAHAQGVSHGDLKPSNILITNEGRVKILDFGLAILDEKLLDPNATLSFKPEKAAVVAGSPPYMAPEQIRGEKITPASDIFAFGLILYEMITAKKAVSGKTLTEIVNQIFSVDAEQFAKGVPQPFTNIIREALASDPSQRRITMDKIRQALS